MNKYKVIWQNICKYCLAVGLIIIAALVPFFSYSLKNGVIASPITENIYTAKDLVDFAKKVNTNASSGAYRNANVYLQNRY